MTNKEFSGKPGFTPKAGAFGEAAAFVREAVKQGGMDREYALKLTDQAYRDTMLAQMRGIDVGLPDELPEQSKILPGATNPDGSVRFSNSK